MTLRLAASTTATPLPDMSSSYIETKTRRPSREVATNRGVLRSRTEVTRRLAAFTTDRTREFWLATYTVRPSGETATPSGSAPTRIVATTAGLATLATRCASGTRESAVAAGAAAGPLGAVAVGVVGAGVAGGSSAAAGGRSRRSPMVRATATPAPPSSDEGGQAGDEHRGAGAPAARAAAGEYGHAGRPWAADLVLRPQPLLDVEARDIGHGRGDLAGHAHVGPAGRAAHGDQPSSQLDCGCHMMRSWRPVQRGAQAGPGGGHRGGGDGERRTLDEDVRDQARRPRRDLAEVHPVRVQAHRRTLERRGRRRGDAAAVVLGQKLQCEPRGSRHGEIGAGRELGQLADAYQARLPDRTVDLGQHMRWQVLFTHRDPTISMR